MPVIRAAQPAAAPAASAAVVEAPAVPAASRPVLRTVESIASITRPSLLSGRVLKTFQIRSIS